MSTPCTLGFWEDHHVDFSGLHQAQAEDGCVEHSNLPTVGVSHRVPQRLVAEWQPEGEYAPIPLEKMRELVAEKYGREEWNRRR